MTITKKTKWKWWTERAALALLVLVTGCAGGGPQSGRSACEQVAATVCQRWSACDPGALPAASCQRIMVDACCEDLDCARRADVPDETLEGCAIAVAGGLCGVERPSDACDELDRVYGRGEATPEGPEEPETPETPRRVDGGATAP